ncbi:PLP-dependent aminotransferase family protein [Paenibacillus sp. GCM10012307]|uniref:PLP-dependent aminotransferase family protein n=1 Tax=Paenibacillus roseus TaxID=2798579 RepID=A0A934MK15_9BACL|nr:PLP-dependent aminotransferase family protein [Paenibacillus roseus]MBJ6360535.1 PLP-dependent aminotransferase family protein [Paenibacillus roseus]
MTVTRQSFQFADRIPSTPSIGSTTVTSPDHVHLSFGFAAPHLFPIEQLNEAATEAITSSGRQALQYSGAGGQGKIRQWIQSRSAVHGMHVKEDELLVTYGSTQGIDLAINVLVNPGDHVWVEAPSFFSALQSLRIAGAKLTSFPIDNDGVKVELIEQALLEAERSKAPLPKLLYIMPTFHNPGGVTLSVERRIRLAELAQRYNFFIIEDDAYMELNFTGEQLPTLYSLCPERVIYLNTFSKIIAPGLRLGWALAQKEVIQKMKLLMLGGSVGVFTQEILAQLLERIDFEDHLGQLKAYYKNNRDIMVDATRQHFGSDVTFHLPQGGFFIWLAFNPGVNTTELLPLAASKGVSFVGGRSFYIGQDGLHYARVCFSYCNGEQITRGIRALAEAYKEWKSGTVQIG